MQTPPPPLPGLPSSLVSYATLSQSAWGETSCQANGIIYAMIPIAVATANASGSAQRHYLAVVGQDDLDTAKVTAEVILARLLDGSDLTSEVLVQPDSDIDTAAAVIDVTVRLLAPRAVFRSRLASIYDELGSAFASRVPRVAVSVVRAV